MYTHVHTYIQTHTYKYLAHKVPKNITLTVMNTNFTINAMMMLHGFSRGEDAPSFL